MENKNQDKEQYFWNFFFSLIFACLVALAVLFFTSKGISPFAIPTFNLIILGLAIFRLIHLFVYDYVTNFIRAYFGKFEKGPGKTISNLLSCPWCSGVWISLAVTFFYFLTPLAWYPILIFAMAGIGTSIDRLINRFS